MSQPFTLSFSGTVEADGTASITIVGWNAGALVSSWNASIQAPQGVVTLKAGATVIGGPIPLVNGAAALGPCQSGRGETVTVNLSGGSSGDNISGSIVGVAFDSFGELGSSAIGYSNVGAFQSDPSQLLTGQLGAPLIENLNINIPVTPGFITWGANGNSQNVAAVEPWNVSGYGAVLVKAALPIPSNVLYGNVSWYDASGGLISTQILGSFSPTIVAVIGALGQGLTFTIGSNGIVSPVTVRNLNLIPLTSLPSRPDLLLDNGATFPPTAPGTDPRAIMNFNNAVGAGSSVDISGGIVWPGKALWSIAPVSTGVTGSTSWWATLNCVDCGGNATIIDTIVAPVAGTQSSGPRLVQLTSGLATVHFVNTGGASITPRISLIATS